MILKKLEIRGIGPFYKPAVIDFDPKVTVLTGRNDTGKSTVLRCLQLIADKPDPLTEDDVNLDVILEATKAWDSNPELGCTATYEYTEHSCTIHCRFLSSTRIAERDRGAV